MVQSLNKEQIYCNTNGHQLNRTLYLRESGADGWTRDRADTLAVGGAAEQDGGGATADRLEMLANRPGVAAAAAGHSALDASPAAEGRDASAAVLLLPSPSCWADRPATLSTHKRPSKRPNTKTAKPIMFSAKQTKWFGVWATSGHPTKRRNSTSWTQPGILCNLLVSVQFYSPCLRKLLCPFDFTRLLRDFNKS